MTLPAVKWSQASIKDVCELIVDCVNKTAPTVPEPTAYKMIRTTNVRDGWVNLSEVKYVTEEVYEKWTRREVPQKGDVILTREAPLGEVGMLRTNDSVFLGQRLVMYRADPEKLDNRFLLYAFQADHLQGQIKSLGSGATVEHMRVPDCEKLVLDLPPLPTQSRIASVLSAYDDLIENNTRRIEILEEMAQAIYREWFVNFRFPGHEKVAMVDSPLGLMPEGWEVRNLFDIAEVTYGFPFKSKLFTQEALGKPVIRIRDIKSQESKTFTPEEAKDKHLVQNGDLLVGMDGDFHMGKWAGGESFLNQRVVRFRPWSGVAPYYLFLALRTPIQQFGATIVGTTVAHLSDRDLRTIRLLIPTEDILQRMQHIFNPIFELELGLGLKNRNLRRTRDLLLPKLISGEVSVEDLSETVLG